VGMDKDSRRWVQIRQKQLPKMRVPNGH
jgi:hypothetical protein